MKQCIVLSMLIVSLLCCNSKGEKINQAEVLETKSDTINTKRESTLNITEALVLGKFNYKIDTTFIKVNSTYSAKEVYLNKDAYKAFLKMYNAAKSDSIELIILSATRNFEEQKAIWERKWIKYKALEPLERAKKILEYSSMPSTSRHHWGTDIDINSLSNSYFSKGKGLKEYEWLTTHANAFGFYQVYTEKDENRTGYNLERWHWSYLPLASQYLEFYNKRIINDNINGFMGYEQAQEVKVIKEYVNGISKKAKDYK